MATITASIGTRSASNVDITGVSGAGPYTVTVDSVPSGTKAGDTLNDEAASPNSYLITGISGSDLTVTDSFGAGAAPSGAGSSQATTERTYSGATTALGSWEADLDDTDLYASGDDAQGETYNDGDTAFDESVDIDGGGTVGLNSVTLTVPEGERHDGTAGTGARIVRSVGNTTFDIGVRDTSIFWLEIDVNGVSVNRTIETSISGAFGSNTLGNLIVHGQHQIGNDHAWAIYLNDAVQVVNTIVYDISTASSSVHQAVGIALVNNFADVYNSTVHNVVDNNGSGNASCVLFGNDSSSHQHAQNIIATDAGGTTSGTVQDFSPPSPVNITMDHNLASDDTASGTGSLINKASTDQFVSIVDGSEDLHLKDGADAIDAGVDLGTTPTGVNIDIDGRDRDAEGDTWDMGAHEFVAVAGGANRATSLALTGVGV